MAISNAVLAQKISDLIDFWGDFNTEYANWLGGSVAGGPSSDGNYPLTDYTGAESLVACPAKLADNVSGYVGLASASETAAAASAVAASNSEIAAAASAVTATAQAVLADADRVAAELAETGAVDAKVTAIAQAAAAVVSAAAALASEVAAAASEAAAAASAAAALASEIAAATFDPVNFYLRTALDGGQLDNRYYTETELDATDALAVHLAGTETIAGIKTFSATSGHTNVNIQKNAAGTGANLTLKNELGFEKWKFGADATTADNLYIARYNDAGVYQDSAIGINNTSGDVTIPNALAVTGAVTGSNLAVANWNTAYGWGNHASAGYLSNAVEDLTPQLGGHLDVNDKDITSALGHVRIYPKTGGYYTMFRNGDAVRFQDSTNTDFAAFAHDGTDFNTTFATTTDWNISGITDIDLTDVGVKWVSGTQAFAIRVDGTDVNFTHASTTDWNITGVTTIQASAVNANFGVVTGSNLAVANWNTAYGWGNHASAGYAAASNFTGVEKRQWTSVSSDPAIDAWYTIFTIADSVQIPVMCNLRAYAHTSVSFVVSESWTTTGQTITILNSAVQSVNAGYKYLKGVRISDAGLVQVQLNSGAIVQLDCQVMTSGAAVTFPSTPTLASGAEVIKDTVTLTQGMLRASGAITGSNLNVSNWDTAYGWGDWAATVALKAPLASPTFTGTVTAPWLSITASGEFANFYSTVTGDEYNYMSWRNSAGTRYAYMGMNPSGNFEFNVERVGGIFSFLDGMSITGDITLAIGADRKMRIGSSTAYYYDLQTVGDDFKIIEAGTTPRLTFDYSASGQAIFNTSRVEVQGSSYVTNPTGMIVGQYTATHGYLQVPGGASGEISIWDNGTVQIANFKTVGKATKLFGTLEVVGTSELTGLVYSNSKLAIDGGDSWLRLNGTSAFTSGIYTSNLIRADGGFLHIDNVSSKYGSSNDVVEYFDATDQIKDLNGATMHLLDGGLALVPNGISKGADAVHIYPAVTGGAYNHDTATSTGYMRIALPAASLTANTMVSFIISGFNYSSVASDKGGGAWAVLVGGYVYAAGSWPNATAKTIAGNPPFDSVSFGKATAAKYILLGTATDTWNYGHVKVTGVATSYTGQSFPSAAWTIDVSASTPAGWALDVTKIVSGGFGWNQTGMSGGGAVTASTGAASGGFDGDIHFQYA